MVTTGFMGAQTTRTGAHDPNAAGNSVIRATLTPLATPLAVCGLGNLGHVGNYRAILRCYPNTSGLTASTGFKIRLSWKEGDGPLQANAWVSPAARNTFSEVDLGIVTIPEKTLGTQRWTGQIEAYTQTTAGDTLDVDYILLYPTDDYGKAVIAPRFLTPTTYTGRDEFDQTAGALAGKTAPVGGVWVGVGTVGDADLTVNAGTHKVDRTTTNPDASEAGRGAYVPQTMTNTLVQIDSTSAVSSVHIVKPQLMARYVDENNYARFMVVYLGPILFGMYLQVVVGGVTTTLITQAPNTPITTTNAHTLRLQVDDTGGMFAWFGDTGTLAGTSPLFSASHPALATGGVLASGFPGFRDGMSTTGAGSILRSYDNFVAASWPTDAVVFSGRAAEINSLKAERADSTGTYYGPIQSYRGARFSLQPAGSANRTNEILVSSKRNNIEIGADDQIADSTTATIHYTPRYIGPPR
jgi:hypothetical protein